MITLREYQEKARDAVLAEWDAGTKATLVAAATGTGKTEMFLSILAAEQERGKLGRAIIIAHRQELIYQPVERIMQNWPELAPAGIVMAGQNEVGARVIVATVQTLASNGRIDQILKAGPVSHLVTDEAHHATSPTFLEVIKRLREANPALRILGVTATPRRTDGEGLKKVFESVAYRISIRDAIKLGALVPFTAVAIELPVSLADVPEAGDGWDDEATGTVLSATNAQEIIIDSWKKYADNRQTIAFTASVAQAHSLARAFNEAGVPAAAADGTTHTDIRREILSGFKRGEYKILVNCFLFVEGVDLPETACILQIKPTKSDLTYVQMAGRGLRLAPGKTDCIAEGQRVLTNQGLVPIERVTRLMKVWDGALFVSHDGAIIRGEQEVITYAGLTATPDHKVWTDTGWRRFGECAEHGIKISVTGNGRTVIRETDGCRRNSANEVWETEHTSAMHNMRRRGTKGQEQSTGSQGGVSCLWASAPCPNVALPSGSVRSAALPESEGQRIRKIWGQRNPILLRVPTGNGPLGSAEHGSTSRFRARPYQQQRPLRTRKPALCDADAEYGEQQATENQRRVSRIPLEASRRTLRRRNIAAITAERADVYPDKGAILPAFIQAKRRVWDILNAGPHHRFTVEGLLVSNCLIMDFVPEDARDMLLAGDLLGKTRKQKKAEEKAGQVGLILDVFGISSDGGSIDGIDPDDVRTRVLNYLTAARLAWTYDGKLATAAVGAQETVVVVFPDAERIAQAEELRAAGKRDENWNETLRRMTGYQVFAINPQVQLMKVAASWDDAVYEAECWAENRMTAILSKRASSWRNSPPSDKQREFAKKLGIWRDGMTRGAVAQAITHELAKRKINNAIRF